MNTTRARKPRLGPGREDRSASSARLLGNGAKGTGTLARLRRIPGNGAAFRLRRHRPWLRTGWQKYGNRGSGKDQAHGRQESIRRSKCHARAQLSSAQLSSAQLSSAQLSGAAAAAAHQRHHHPDPPAACSTGCCWSWTAAAPACVPFLRHRKATGRQWQQRQESGACAEHKKASAACKLAEAGKIRISKRPDRISWWPARTGSRGHPAGCGRPEPRCPCRSRRSSGTARWRKAAPRRSGGHRASPAVWSAG
jgi:hypothetical protein